ncbi:unnamed protein product [Phytophthora fragariaefolia]|uniref:Unnamed protein product n=1 Tax=Phytophthora fragariaefolia TaxID=1490495 RepID=A0A9W6XY81_9STRA|nr:unnamed protein product [Phytophthora fragariaefolia]
MSKSLLSPGGSILRAKPLYELSDTGIDSRYRVRNTTEKIVCPAPVERSVPFDSETILETVDCPPTDYRGSSHPGLTNLSLELADFEDLCNDTASAPIDGDSDRHSWTQGIGPTEIESDLMPSSALARGSIVLAPLKTPSQVLCVFAALLRRHRRPGAY